MNLDDLPPHLQGLARAKLAEERRADRAAAGIESAPEDRTADEKRTQADCVKVIRALGGTVHSTSQARAAKVTPGMPDLWVSFARHRRQFWWETKRPDGGRLSPAQVAFAEDCLACGTAYGSGPRAALEAYLIELGIATRMYLPDGRTVLEPTDPSVPIVPATPLGRPRKRDARRRSSTPRNAA